MKVTYTLHCYIIQSCAVTYTHTLFYHGFVSMKFDI